VTAVPSVLWRCWLGSRKGIQTVKNWVVGCWHGCLSGARCRLAYSRADAAATHCLLLQQISDWFSPFWYWLTRVVPEKGPLNVMCMYVLVWLLSVCKGSDTGVTRSPILHGQWDERSYWYPVQGATVISSLRVLTTWALIDYFRPSAHLYRLISRIDCVLQCESKT